MPQTWCGGLITPIFKSGTKNDPSNYRGICSSSCLGKLFCSILNQRLLEHVQSLDILHNSQIGFLAKNRTADNVLTLRTLIAELLCGRRPQKWSPIPILRGMLVIFYGHGKRNGSRARAPHIHTWQSWITLNDQRCETRATAREPDLATEQAWRAI